MPKFNQYFDTLITCTGKVEPIITEAIFKKINPLNLPKIIIDLAVPHDVDSKVSQLDFINYIDIIRLQDLAEKNLQERKKALPQAYNLIKKNTQDFVTQWKERKIELLLQPIPQKIKEIKTLAMEDVFSSELAKLDAESLDTLEKIINYFEKKYISIPIKMAKEILVKNIEKA